MEAFMPPAHCGYSQSLKMTLLLARVKMEAVQLVGIQWHQQSGRYPSSDLRFSLPSNTTNHTSAHLGRPLPTLARRWSDPPPFSWGPWMSAGLWTWLLDADEVNTLKEGEGSERSCSSFTFCSSREGTSESGRLYRPLLLILVPSLSPSTHTTIYNPGQLTLLQRTLTVRTWQCQELILT